MKQYSELHQEKHRQGKKINFNFHLRFFELFPFKIGVRLILNPIFCETIFKQDSAGGPWGTMSHFEKTLWLPPSCPVLNTCK